MKISERSTRATVTGSQKLPIGVLDTYIDPNGIGTFTTRYFNVEFYGAVHNLQTVFDGVMTSGSAVLTSASGLFVSGDVGKVIVVSRAGTSNVPLRTTILSYQSATQVTLATNAGASVTAQMIDWGTDDTAAIQLAINAANTAGAGKVFFPIGRYMIAGNLVTNVSGVNPNAQLYIPPSSATLTDLTTISLVGEAAFTLPTLRDVVAKNGVILKSVRLGSGTFPTLLGGIGPSGSYLDYNYNDVRMENISVMVYTNNGTSAPSMSGIDFKHIATVSMKNVSANIDVGMNNSVTAASAEFGGIIVGGRDNNGPNVLQECSATGFKYGFAIGEHSQVINCYAFGCNNGFAFTTQNYMIVGHILTHYCINQILFPTASILGLDYDAAKRMRLNLTLECEFDVFSEWWDTQTFISDSGNRARGQIKYLWLHGGAERNYEALDLTTGALNIELLPIDGYSTLASGVTANTNNFTSTTINAVNRLLLNPNSNWDLTGIAGGRMFEGREMVIRNVSTTNTLTIKNDVTSTAANRFLMNADFALLPNMSAKFTYDITAARWIKL